MGDRVVTWRARRTASDRERLVGRIVTDRVASDTHDRTTGRAGSDERSSDSGRTRSTDGSGELFARERLARDAEPTAPLAESEIRSVRESQ
jgi:hypothetical protein